MNKDKSSFLELITTEQLKTLEKLKINQLRVNERYKQNLDRLNAIGLTNLTDNMLIDIVAEVEYLKNSKLKYDKYIESDKLSSNHQHKTPGRDLLIKEMINLQLLIVELPPLNRTT